MTDKLDKHCCNCRHRYESCNPGDRCYDCITSDITKEYWEPRLEPKP